MASHEFGVMKKAPAWEEMYEKYDLSLCGEIAAVEDDEVDALWEHFGSIPCFWHSLPIFCILFAKEVASSFVFINAPFPQVTSNTIALAPAAIFLLIMLELMSGMLSVQAIISLSAYSFLSAGAKLLVCPIKLIPILCT